MKYVVMAVRDEAARAFLPPMFVSTVQVGVRSFRQACNTPGTAIGDTPTDFSLYVVGLYDDETAAFELRVNQELIMKGARDV